MPATATRITEAEAEALFAAGVTAACAAYIGATPTVVQFGSPKDMAASLMGGDDGGFDPSQPIYTETEGVCGFGWVELRPNRGVLAKVFKARGARKGVYGGLTLWSSNFCHDTGQSYERKYAAAQAFVKVFEDAGVEGVSAHGRLD